MCMAARPTAFIVMAPKRKGSMPPMKRPTISFGSVMETSPSFAAVAKAPKSDRAVSAAEPMAKPLPMAAVVLPTESSVSVILRTLGSRWLISAMPPALSAMGP